MGHRLTKIYTRTGDKGTTGLADGSRVDKDDCRIEAFGDIDELNSAIGVIISLNSLPQNVIDILITIQNELFELGGELCMPNYQVIQAQHVINLEQHLDHLNEELKPLKEFILPGGHIASAHTHLARTICRRAERHIVTLSKKTPVRNEIIQYLNRLSDLLFVLARYINHHHQIPEPFWQHERK